MKNIIITSFVIVVGLLIFLTSNTLAGKSEDASTAKTDGKEAEAPAESFTEKAAKLEGESTAKTNEKEAEAPAESFMEKAAKLEGAKTTSSGLVYIIEKSGDENNKPRPRDTVEVHYEGTLADGTIFDSSYQRNQSISFGLNQVIPGWTEGMQLVGKGGTIILYIPSELAYGSRGAGNVIPPNAPLRFKVELINIVRR